MATEKPFYSDGTTANFAIANVSACGETISFDLLEMGKQLLLSEETMTLKGQQNSGATLTIASDVAWTITGVPDWLTVSPASAGAGTTTVSITAVSDNETGAEREAVLTVSSSTDASLQKTVTIRQEAKTSGIILFDDFENTANPHGWIIENQGENGSGWQYCEGTTTGKAKKMVNSGTHALLMKETIMEDLHQESRLTSPVFAGGKTLSFYSHCNGGNSTPKNPPVYIIEVSSDGGSTWNTIFDVLKDYPRNEEGNTVNLLSYTKITLDLSPYTSDNMRIRFNCYDNTNEGLQYWWQIDDLEISAEVPSHVTGIPNADTRNESVYDLRGQRITTPATRGIYIIGGRKVMRSEK